MTSKNLRPAFSGFLRAGRLAAFALVLCLLASAAAMPSARASEAYAAISLSDSAITADYPGVYVDGSAVTITLPGEYLLQGALSNGQIIVDCEQEGKVKLYFNGVSVHCENGPALYIKKCSPRLSIALVDGTVNELSDGTAYAGDSKTDAVIYSKSDLTITGTGTLNVTGNCRDGIVSKDDLRIKGGVIHVNAAHNGIVGKDCVEIYDGEITVRAGNDGIKTTNEDAGWGYIAMEGGTVSILSGDDALSYVRGLAITGGALQAVVDPSLKTDE